MLHAVAWVHASDGRSCAQRAATAPGTDHRHVTDTSQVWSQECSRSKPRTAAAVHYWVLRSGGARKNSLHPSCRLGHDTRHFNVGQYRRKQRGDDAIQDASFFDHKNPVRSIMPFTSALWLSQTSLHGLLRQCSTSRHDCLGKTMPSHGYFTPAESFHGLMRRHELLIFCSYSLDAVVLMASLLARQVGMAMREQALHAALDEMTAWLDLASSQVAVFDATNSTEDRRNKLVRMPCPCGVSDDVYIPCCSPPV